MRSSAHQTPLILANNGVYVEARRHLAKEIESIRHAILQLSYENQDNLNAWPFRAKYGIVI
jgi:hypothetical protein